MAACGSLLVGLKDGAITGFVWWLEKWGFSVTSFSKPSEVVEVLEPNLLWVVVFFVRTRLDLLLQLRLLPVLLRLQRNRVGMSYSGLEFGTAMGGRTGAVVRVAGLMESGLGTWVGMRTGLMGGFGMGIGMLGLLL